MVSTTSSPKKATQIPVPEEKHSLVRTQLKNASVIALLAVYDGILKGLNGIDSPKIKTDSTARPLPPDLKTLATRVYAAKNALEATLNGRKIVLPRVSEANAQKMIDRSLSTYLDNNAKDIAKWFIGTTPTSDAGKIIFVEEDTTGLEGLERIARDARDARGEVLVQC